MSSRPCRLRLETSPGSRSWTCRRIGSSLLRTIGKLQSLCSLRIWFNRLDVLPAEIGELYGARGADRLAERDRGLAGLLWRALRPPGAQSDRQSDAEASASGCGARGCRHSPLLQRASRRTRASFPEVGEACHRRRRRGGEDAAAAPGPVASCSTDRRRGAHRAIWTLSMLGVKSKEAGSDGKGGLAALF